MFIIVGITACGGSDANTTMQVCNGAVNVNSCTSNNSNIQNTVIAGWQLQTAQQQATAQVNLDATVVAQASTQNRTDKEESVVSIANIVVPLAFFISIIAFFASFGQDSATVKVVTGIIAILLLIIVILIW